MTIQVSIDRQQVLFWYSKNAVSQLSPKLYIFHRGLPLCGAYGDTTCQVIYLFVCLLTNLFIYLMFIYLKVDKEGWPDRQTSRQIYKQINRYMDGDIDR